jgi:hypothetical protein
MMKYQEPGEVSRAELERARSSEDGPSIRAALVGLALNEGEDWRWVESQCIELLMDRDWEVRAIAATCLGHVARIHGQMDLEIAVPALRALQDDPKTASFAGDALEDIETYISK